MASHRAEPTPAERDANRIRFETELEFVQCLANPFYLQSLAQQGLFEQPTFLNYLKYLLYFRDPRYARFLQYPTSLEHLALLTAPDPAGQMFRTTLRDQPLMAQEWAGKMVARWAGWREREVVGPAREGGEEAPASANGGVATAGVNGAAP
ncbi:Mediator of RNA polymerase II transcription subunit 31 [Rhodotorula sphaerocarpa]